MRGEKVTVLSGSLQLCTENKFKSQFSVSIRDEDDILEYSTDPELIHEKYENLVDLVIDGGYGDNVASTVVDLTEGEFEVIRAGKGNLEEYL